MQVAWVHNFNKNGAQGSGVFMWQLRDAVEREGVAIKDIFIGSMRSAGNLAKAVHKIKSEVADCDLIHVQFGSLCGLLGSRVPGKKILSLRGSDWHTIPWSVSRSQHFHSRAANLFTKRSLGRYDRIIAVSKRMGEGVRRQQAGINVEIIPSGVDLGKFHPLDRMECRALLGNAGDTRPWVLFSSVTDENPLKRKSLALAAVEEAKKTLPDISVRYLNDVPHKTVPLHMNAADVVLLTSTHEGWPNIVKEGLACDIPFVSTDVSDLREVALATRNCDVTEPTPEALGAALVRSLTGPKETGLSELIADMEISITARKLITVYESVCQDRGTSGR